MNQCYNDYLVICPEDDKIRWKRREFSGGMIGQSRLGLISFTAHVPRCTSTVNGQRNGTDGYLILVFRFLLRKSGVNCTLWSLFCMKEYSVDNSSSLMSSFVRSMIAP